MSVYAAQIDRMDRNIGRIMEKVRQMGLEQNTLVMFLSDNGGDSEDIDEGKPGSLPGEPDSIIGYGPRLGQRQQHAVPPVQAMGPRGRDLHAADRLLAGGDRRNGRIDHQVGHIVDILPTCLEAAGVAYPKTYQGRSIQPTEGISLLPAFRGQAAYRA